MIFATGTRQMSPKKRGYFYSRPAPIMTTSHIEAHCASHCLPRPVSKRGHSASIFGSSSMGATIVDSMDTLYIMGMMDEFNKGKDWIGQNLDLNQMSGDVSGNSASCSRSFCSCFRSRSLLIAHSPSI